jgi:hypothetical protein
VGANHQHCLYWSLSLSSILLCISYLLACGNVDGPSGENPAEEIRVSLFELSTDSDFSFESILIRPPPALTQTPGYLSYISNEIFLVSTTTPFSRHLRADTRASVRCW